jgi:hypothetical protein
MYRKDKGKVITMLLASLDDAFALLDNKLQLPNDTFVDPDPPTLDNVSIISHTDHLSIVSSSVYDQNQNITHDLYPMCDSKLLACASVADDMPIAFLSMGGWFNSCLDSGCMDYIITDRKLFHFYDTLGSVNIGTGNCGSLSAIASGDIIFCMLFEDCFVLFTLCHCLHAPNAPINLLFVRALNDSRLTVTFVPKGPTRISYSISDPVLPGFTFSATVIRCLSFLTLDFVCHHVHFQQLLSLKQSLPLLFGIPALDIWEWMLLGKHC